MQRLWLNEKRNFRFFRILHVSHLVCREGFNTSICKATLLYIVGQDLMSLGQELCSRNNLNLQNSFGISMEHL